MDLPGFYKGRHYSEYILDVHHMVRAGRIPEVAPLMEHLIRTMEAQNRVEQRGVETWPYDVLAHTYVELGQLAKAVATYERYGRQPHVMEPTALDDQLERARGRLVG